MRANRVLKQTVEMTRDELVAEAVANSINVSRDPRSSGRFLTAEMVNSKSDIWLSRFVNTSRRILELEREPAVSTA